MADHEDHGHTDYDDNWEDYQEYADHDYDYAKQSVKTIHGTKKTEKIRGHPHRHPLNNHEAEFGIDEAIDATEDLQELCLMIMTPQWTCWRIEANYS